VTGCKFLFLNDCQNKKHNVNDLDWLRVRLDKSKLDEMLSTHFSSNERVAIAGVSHAMYEWRRFGVSPPKEGKRHALLCSNTTGIFLFSPLSSSLFSPLLSLIRSFLSYHPSLQQV